MIWTSAEAKAIDQRTSKGYGVPSLKLMEEAGQAIYRLALRLWKPHHALVVLAGAGNNGGDGLVAARLLHAAGFEVLAYSVVGGTETSERQYQKQRYELAGGSLIEWPQTFAPLIGRDLIVIDALLGIGLHGALRDGPVQDCLLAARDLKAEAIIAVDLPSGLDADRFGEQYCCLPATHTITFGAYKPVHVGEPSRRHCGELHLAKLSFYAEPEVMGERDLKLDHSTKVYSLADLWRFLPPAAHKYDRGHVLAIGGSPGKVGAILIAAEAAETAGAGWVSVAPLSLDMAPSWPRSFTYEDFAASGRIDEERLTSFIKERRVKAVLIGPGTMSTPLTKRLLEDLAKIQREDGLRLIFDAGALQNILAKIDGFTFDPEHTLFTPHPGEWQKLKEGMPTPEAVSDLPAITALLAAKGVTSLYKSASPMALGPGRVSFMTRGDNRLGRAGSGDTLAGLILGLAATPRSLHDLAVIAQNMLAAAAAKHERSYSPLELQLEL